MSYITRKQRKIFSQGSTILLSATFAMLGMAACHAGKPKPPPTGTVVACVGDSITAGYALTLPSIQAYPAQLQSMLGSTYSVSNFGVSSTTMEKTGNLPYWNQTAYTNSMKSNPKYVIIALGTNDSKPPIWNSTQYINDYKTMISNYKSLASAPTVFASFIPPYYMPNPWPTDFPDPTRIPNLVLPAIQQVISATGAPSVNFYDDLVNKSQLYNDGIHPTVDGANTLAVRVYNAITGANISLLAGTNINDGGGSYGGNTANTASAAFDHNSNTFYDAAIGAGWDGIDLGSTNTKSVKMISFSPRAGYESRMVGGQFQGSNDGTNWYNLANAISASPSDTYTSIQVTGAPVYRYLRYVSSASGFCNVAEIEFFGN